MKPAPRSEEEIMQCISALQKINAVPCNCANEGPIVHANCLLNHTILATMIDAMKWTQGTLNSDVCRMIESVLEQAKTL